MQLSTSADFVLIDPQQCHISALPNILLPWSKTLAYNKGLRVRKTKKLILIFQCQTDSSGNFNSTCMSNTTGQHIANKMQSRTKWKKRRERRSCKKDDTCVGKYIHMHTEGHCSM